MLVGIAMVSGGLLVSRILRTHVRRVADISLALAAALARVLGGVVFAFIAARALEDPDALWIGVAVFFCVLALWSTLSAGLLLYAVATDDEGPASSRSSSPERQL